MPQQEPEEMSPEEEEEEEEEGEEEEPEPAETSAQPSVVPAFHRNLKRRKRRTPEEMAAARAAGQVKERKEDDWPLQAVEVWERIVNEFLPEKNLTPQHVHCLVYRFGMGAFSGQIVEKDQVYVARIEGASIAGTSSLSPGEALTDYMETVVHPQAGGPARYQLSFNKLRAPHGGTIKMGHMSLPHPTEVARRRAFANEYEARQMMSGGVDPMMGPPAMPRTGYGQPPQAQPYPPQQFQPPPYYPFPPPQQTQSESQVFDLLRQVLVQRDEAVRREAEARGQPAPPPLAPPPPLENELARALDAALERRFGKSTGVGAPIAATRPVSFVEQVESGMDMMLKLMDTFNEFDKRRKVRGLGGEPQETVVEVPPPTIEDPNRPAFGVRPIPTPFKGHTMMWPMPIMENGERIPESQLEWAKRWAATNPGLVGEFLEWASKRLSQGALGQILQAFTQQGGQAAQAAATMTDRVAAGVAAPNGAASPTGYPFP